MAIAAIPARHDCEERSWMLGSGSGHVVINMLRAEGWSVVDTPEANTHTHCSSPDGRAYVGWIPESIDNYRDRRVWRVSVTGADGRPGWAQTFGVDVPSEAVAGFIAALIRIPVGVDDVVPPTR